MGKSFLIIQTAFLGDAILATALAESLHKEDSDHEISLLVRKGNESLFRNHPFLKEVLVWDKINNKIPNLLNIIRIIRGKRYDVTVNLQRFFSTGLITALSGSKLKIGFNKNPLSLLFNKKVEHVIGDGTHEVDRNLQLINEFSSDSNSKPRLYPGEVDYIRVKNIINIPYVILAPASVWKTKQLPEHKWVELGELCKAKFKIVFAGAGNDIDLCKQIAGKIGTDNCIIAAGKLNLLESAALIEGASMTYVNDSGPLHIASAVNAPVTAFFCSTIPSFGFGPLSTSSHIVESKSSLSCKPCGIHGKKSCPLEHFNCGNGISITTHLIP